MSHEKVIYLIPYAGSLGISLGILLYVWIRHEAQGATAFFWYILGQSLYILGNILEMVVPDLSSKLFWDSFQWVIASLPLVAFPIFAIQYTEYKIRNYRKLFVLSLVAPAIFSLLVITDAFHNLIYLNPRVLQNGLFTTLVYDYSPIFIIYSIYIYFITFMSCTLLVLRMMQPHNLYRSQIALILAGLLLPIAGSILSLLNMYLNSQRDASPFTVAMGNFLLVWGLYRFHIFDILPIARDKVFEALVEPVVVLDNKDNVVDVNSSMLALLGREVDDIIGQPAKMVFDDFPIPIKQYMQTPYARAEATFVVGGIYVYYELTVWPIYNKRKEMTGRIYISHDITVQKELERELRKLNSELEDRVRARTWELAEAYDTTLEGWARALELRDKETEGHSRRVTEITLKIARAMDISEENLKHVRRGALLHDIGKMSVPDEILHKPGELTDEERVIIKGHPDTAYKLLSPITFLKKALEIPRYHHEKWDGTGYPQGLKGEEIPLAARIFAIADVWDALSSNRPYNQAWMREKTISYLVEQSGKHFDPSIVNVFLGLIEKGEI
jgi:putative nucleotidyltransferase with HDIG domain/PAS domain S-box-containing protein